MNGPQTGTENATLTHQSDNLDVVLSRFQSWADTQRIRPGRPTPPSTRFTPEAREISYEQAMRASSYRRPAHAPADSGSPVPIPPLAVPPQTAIPRMKPRAAARVSQPMAEPPSARPAEENQPPMAMPANAASVEDIPRLRELRVTAAAQAIAQAAAQELTPEAPSAPPSSRAKPKQTKSPVIKAKAAQPGKGTTRTSRNSAEKSRKSPAGPRARTASAKRPLASQINAENQPPAPPPAISGASRTTDPAFPRALEHALALATATPGKLTPSITVERDSLQMLTLKVSEREKSRIEANAAQLSLSLNDYLMQCALADRPPTAARTAQIDLSESIFLRQYAVGVDELRDQMKLALAHLNRRHSQRLLEPSPGRGLAALPALLARFALRSLNRFRKNPTHPSATIPP